MTGRRVRAALGVSGALATALAAVAAFAPGALTGTVALPGLVTEADGPALALAAAVGGGLALLYATGRSPGDRTIAGDGDAAAAFERAVESPPEEVTAGQRRLTGNDLDRAIGRATAGEDGASGAVRERLTDAARRALVRGDRRDRQTAERLLAAGDWTDDPVAAAFLAGPGGPSPSRAARIRLWLDPERERRRRIARTVAAIDALDRADARGASEPVTPGPTSTETRRPGGKR